MVAKKVARTADWMVGLTVGKKAAHWVEHSAAQKVVE